MTRQHTSRPIPGIMLRLCALTLACWPALAQAEPISVTVSGIIAQGQDQLGLFGPAGSNLAGKTFVQTLRGDSLGLQAQLQYPGVATYIAAAQKKPFSATVTVDGHSYAFTVDQADPSLALWNTLSQNLDSAPNQLDQINFGLAGTNNIERGGLLVNAMVDLHSRQTRFLPELAIQPRRTLQPWATATDSWAFFLAQPVLPGGQSYFSATLASLAWNQPAPAAAQIQYIDTVGLNSGSVVNVAWVKWWGEAGERWQLLRNGSIVCQGNLTLDARLDPLQQQQASCAAHVGSGDNQFVLRLCQGEQCTDSAPYHVTLAEVAVRGTPAGWRADAVYQQGDQVNYQGRIYQARYWVQATLPVDTRAWQQIANLNVAQATATISDWKYGAQAAYSIMFDDYCAWSNDAGIILGEQELARRNLVAAFGVIPGSCGDAAWSSHWPNLKAFIGRGHEVFNHSWDHGHPQDADWAYKKWGGNDLEILDSSKKVAQELGGYQMQLFGFPFDVANPDQLAYLQARPQYLGTRAPNYWQANGVNDKDFADPFKIRFQVYANADQGSDNPASLANFLQQTIAQQGWGMRVFHSVQDSYYESVPLAAYQAHLDQVAARVTDGSLWVGSASEVLKYRFAREHCRLKPLQNVAQGWLLSFDNLDPSCSKYATSLTLALSLPAAQRVTVLQGGKELTQTLGRNAQGVLQTRVQVQPQLGDVLIR